MRQGGIAFGKVKEEVGMSSITKIGFVGRVCIREEGQGNREKKILKGTSIFLGHIKESVLTAIFSFNSPMFTHGIPFFFFCRHTNKIHRIVPKQNLKVGKYIFSPFCRLSPF